MLPRALRSMASAYMRMCHSVRIVSPCRVPDRGPAIIAPNHTSGMDPLIVQLGCRRHIYWMMASEYMDIPHSAWFWKAAAIIPVDRNGRDSTATREALRVLAGGGLLGIFPEGRISPTPQMLPLHPGIALLADRSNAPIYPVRIDGNHFGHEMLEVFFRPNRLSISFGNPIKASEKADETMLRLTQAYELLKLTNSFANQDGSG